MKNRREFLKTTSLLAAGGLLAGKSGIVSAAEVAAPSMVQKKVSKVIGLQIYSLGRELHEDVAGGLKKVAKMGYSTIELAGYNDGKIGNVSMADFKKMSDDAGLKITSTHVNPSVREYTKANKQQIMDFWKKAADDHAKIGVKYLIQPGQPATRSTEEVAYVGEIFTEAGKIAKAAGLSFGYHNHDGEFARVIPGGKEAMERLPWGQKPPEGIEIIYDGMLRHTDPSLVFFEMDVYWTVMGRQDPVEYMQKYADRIRVLHIKDRAVLGQSGMMNFEMIFKQAYANRISDYFVELEKYSGGTQFEGVKGCADYLLKAKFVK
ncbi:sugar phosphate isomerase/epimerase [Parabacteroides sp. PH5-13]|uniref:sugar phosphate isomerase/epimerase family protein n=1 Tax=unclassified Parabacteroides TaxID=2649774 RepID=UPI002476CF13|nr:MULTISPECIES: sugar phosphate isomerase/epimerase [unclassified Parabacteroides]MDH6304808.1 sugar phosphate isomerase/epimerase [Parabacteroides sp. PH5-39]MDH6315578.1 sugar phosphate isomerase/epimerase [Parabacteroides sp. PF5-13]MDH6319238.1 sugar phosphate isomerase/epimerase [Parabacteroides sp. PH5-13]MDH6326771.1 sugar phosphate isomerase/epimerase [Parabacteroides sp. PH5-41]MDH6345864.1 sugar phosphate isomerase/epimerase [Parabacteroides sp. PH5-46]